MNVLGGLILIAIVLSGPIAFLMMLRHSREIRELRREMQRLRASKAGEKVPFEPSDVPFPSRAEPSHAAGSRVEVPPPLPITPVELPSPTPPPPHEAPRAPEAKTPIARNPPPQKRDWEQWVGGALLNRIGIVLVVLGITFALGYTFHRYGAAGKAVLSTIVSISLLVFGVVLERKPRYRFQARGLVAGGWAALFVTAYAIHALPATRIVDDPRLGFAILIAVAAGMIVHSLRYKTQAVTAIAYALAYSAIVVHSVELYTVAAATLLGIGSLLHLMRRRWYFLAISGIVSTYGSVLLWYLRQGLIDHDQLLIALAAVGINWLVFLTADFSAQDPQTTPAWKPRLVAHLNGACAVLLGTLVASLYGHEQLYVPSLALGLLYVVAALLSRRMKRDVVAGAHTILATLALGYAAWLHFELRAAAWIWLAEAEAAFLLGLSFKDERLRRFGVVYFLAPLMGIVIADGGARFHQHDGAFDFDSLVFTTVAIVCFYHAFMQQRRFATSPESDFDRALSTFTSFGGFVLVLFTAWIQLPHYLLAPADVALAISLFVLSARFARRDLRIQSHAAGILAGFVGLGVVFGRNEIVNGIAVCVPSTIATALGFYAFVLALGRRRAEGGETFDIAKLLYGSAATILLTTMIGQHADEELVGPYFVGIALVLLEAGIVLNECGLRNSAYAFSILATAALGEASIDSTRSFHDMPSRLLTTIPSLVILYAMWLRVRQLPQLARGIGDGFDQFFGRAISYYSFVTLLHLLDASFAPGGSLVPDSIVLIALFVAGTKLRDADFRLQGYFLGVFLLLRSLARDFESLPEFASFDGTVAFTFASVTAFVACGGLVRAHRASLATRPDRRTLRIESFIARFGADGFFLGAVAFTFVYLARTRAGFELSVAFAIEGLIATAAGFYFKSRAVRVGGLLVLGIALVLTIERAFTTFDTIGRIVSFLVLGGVLLAISLVYARIRGNAQRETGAQAKQGDESEDEE